MSKSTAIICIGLACCVLVLAIVFYGGAFMAEKDANLKAEREAIDTGIHYRPASYFELMVRAGKTSRGLVGLCLGLAGIMAAAFTVLMRIVVSDRGIKRD